MLFSCFNQKQLLRTRSERNRFVEDEVNNLISEICCQQGCPCSDRSNRKEAITKKKKKKRKSFDSGTAFGRVLILARNVMYSFCFERKSFMLHSIVHINNSHNGWSVVGQVVCWAESSVREFEHAGSSRRSLHTSPVWNKCDTAASIACTYIYIYIYIVLRYPAWSPLNSITSNST